MTYTSFNNTIIIKYLYLGTHTAGPHLQFGPPYPLAPEPISAYTDENVSCCNAGSGANPGTGTGTVTGTGEFIYPVDI